MPLKLRVEPELDSRSLDDVQSQARNVFDALGPELGEGLTRGIASELDKIGPSFVNLGSAASSAMSEVSVGAVAGVAAFAALAVAIEQVGEAFYGVGQRFDAISDSMAARTGMLGSDLDALNASIERVGSTTASSLEQLGDIGSRVSQSFGLAGPQLEDLTKQIADLNRMTGEALDIRQLDLAFSSFGINVGQTSAALDDLYRVSTSTGIPINELSTALQRLGPVAGTLGLDLSDVESVIIGLNKSGLDAGSTVQGLNRAATVFAANGINMKTGLEDTVAQMRHFIDVGNEAAAVTLAKDVFGSRNAELFVKAVRDGTLSVETLHGSLAPIGPSIDEMDRKTADWAETWQMITNRVSTLANVIGGPLFDGINAVMQASIADPMSILNPNYDLSGSAEDRLNAALDRKRLDEALSKPGGAHPGVTAPVPQREQEDIRGKLDAEKNKASGGAGGGPQVPYPPGYGSPPSPGQSYEDWQKGQQALEDQHAVDEAKAKLNALPPGASADQVIAAQNDLREASERQQANLNKPPPKGPSEKPPGFESPQVPLPPGYEGADAKQQAYLDAVHKREEAEANLQALQQSGTATQNDMIKAQNDLIKARTDEQQALTALTESTSKVSDSLGDIGVKLDQDFGLSKGLPGLAENLVRFLGSLGAAGVEGAGRQIQSELGYPGGKGSGSGLMGILGSAGAFGPQYTEAGGGGRFANSGGEGGAQFPFGGFPGGAFPGGYPQGESGLPITYPGGSPYPASGQPSGDGGIPAANAAAPGPQGVARTIYQMARARGYSHTDAISIVAYAVGESSLNPGISGGAQGGPGYADTVIGLFQQKPAFAIAGGIDPSQRGNPYYNTLAYLNQLDRHPGPDIYSRLLATSSGGPLYTGGRGVMPGLEARARQYLGFAGGGGVDTVPAMLEPGEHVLTTADVHAMGGQDAVYGFRQALHAQGGGDIPKPPPGLPGAQTQASAVGQPRAMPQPPPAGVPSALPGAGAPHAPAGAGPTMIGGAAPFAGYGPGFAVTGGGLVGLLESLPATAINAAITAAAAAGGHEGGAVGLDGIRRFEGGGDVGGASGSIISAAINIGMEELNRAIGFAGQAAGIGVSGLMETFLPTGASELANNNWFTRFLGGIVGARPALPNIAGAAANATSRPSPEMLGPPPLRTEHYGTHAPPGPGNVSNTGVHIENYNVIASEDRAGQDLARHQMNQWQPQSGNR